MTQAAAVSAPATLDEAIEATIEDGVTDPVGAVEAIKEKLGDAWLKKAVSANADRFATDRARQILGSERRQAEKRAAQEGKTNGGKAKTSTLASACMWVPDDTGGRFIPYPDLTAEDFRAKGRYYRDRAAAFSSYASWLYDVADAMDAEGVSVFSDMAETPAPPAGVEAEEILGDPV